MNLAPNKINDAALRRQAREELLLLTRSAGEALQHSELTLLSRLTHNIRGVAEFFGEHHVARVGKLIEESLSRGRFSDTNTLLLSLENELSRRLD